MHTDIHASTGIRTHDFRVRESKDSSCLRPRGHTQKIVSTPNFQHVSRHVETVEWIRQKEGLFNHIHWTWAIIQAFRSPKRLGNCSEWTVTGHVLTVVFIQTAPPFLTSTLDGAESTTLRLGCFTPGEITPITRWIGGLVDPTASLVYGGEDKNLSPAGNRTPVVQPVARRYTDWAIPTRKYIGTWPLYTKVGNFL
jgi:hypothetical protein